MNNLLKNGYARRLMITVICDVALSLLLVSTSSFAAPPSLSAAPQETLRLGERVYREGVLPSGEPLQASLKGGHSAPGTTFACVSCHLRSGLGSLNDNTIIPPINGAKLFKPLQIYSSPRNIAQPFKPRVVLDLKEKYYQVNQRRPVYTDTSLAYALRDGIDSAGRKMNDVMPRYLLDDENMKIVISYLRSLSSKLSPGVSDTAIRFATIITDDISPEYRNAMLAPLENFIKNKNLSNANDLRGSRSRSAGLRSRSAGARSRIMAETSYDMRGVATRELSLSRWVLKGSPETWRAQLEEYYRKEPVFALLGGITNGEWEPIHQFCEENHIPSIFPITDFPVISQAEWYTLYLSKGYYQEGEGAANFLNDKEELKDKSIVEIIRDTREGRALARGFLETWRDSEQKMPVTVILKPDETLTAELLQQKLPQEKPAVIILWDGPESLKELEMLSAMKNRPAMVLVSSSYLGKSMFSLDEKVRNFTFMTYPYGMSQAPEEKSEYYFMNRLKEFNPEVNAVATTRISQQTYILTLVMDMALVEMRGDYYRDNLLDVIGTVMGLDVPLYDRLSFGPGVRYGSKGCHIVQLSKSGKIEKSGWISGWATQ
jgi:ABC-type branched-subunit amino acid transport system substrate-binding protein